MKNRCNRGAQIDAENWAFVMAQKATTIRWYKSATYAVWCEGTENYTAMFSGGPVKVQRIAVSWFKSVKPYCMKGVE